jgi:Xaa-Pro dipeptidase
MTIGVGGNSQQQALDTLTDMTTDIQPITESEYQARIHKAQQFMQTQGIDALYLNAGTNLTYFSGLKWYASERMVGAILPSTGELEYIAPEFEIGSLNDFMQIEGPINAWLEHQNPYQLLTQTLQRMGLPDDATIAIDESTQFFVADGIRLAQPSLKLINGSVVTAHCRMHKSAAELALIQRAMDMTLAVHKATASMLYEGISTKEVEEFIQRAHRKVGAPGNYFCIVLFGKATSFPHGVKEPQFLKDGDMVLIDTGCQLHGYLSDITRTYVYGEPNTRQRTFWEYEREAQTRAFNAARPGATCGDVDKAARAYLEEQGLGPEYKLPGLPHRTGHGIGMDIHEWPYLVKDNPQILAPGMCFSNEPMLVVPGEFGVRLEDHFYVTEQGARWFTLPSHSLDDPFGQTQV